MDWMEMLQKIFEVCIIPLLGILTAYFVQWIKAKSREITEKTENELGRKYIEMATQTICDCVVATNQTYVEALKDRNAFDEAAQKVAFQKTYKAVLDILSDDCKNYLTNIFGDLETYLINHIEAAVNTIKHDA